MATRIPPPWMIEEIEQPIYEEVQAPIEAPPPTSIEIDMTSPGYDATPTEVDFT